MRSLEEIHDNFSRELDDVLSTFNSAPTIETRTARRFDNHRASREGVVVHTFDAWGRFIRSAVLVSSCRVVKGIGGATYGPPPFPTHRAAMAHLNLQRRSIQAFRYGEPSWHLQHSALDAVSVLQPPNAQQIRAALGGTVVSSATGVSVASPIADLQVIRNYIAHKGPSAGARVKAILQPVGARSVLEWLDQPVAGIPRFHELVANLRALSDVAAH